MSDRWKSSSLILVVIALLICPSMAFAAGAMQFGICGFGGYNTYKMADLNDEIAALNAEAAAAGENFKMDEIKHGLGFGGGIQAWVTKDFMISAEYERLLAKSKAEADVSGVPIAFELKVPASAFTLTGAYMFPSPSKARFGIGAGVGYYNTTGTAKLSVGGVPQIDDEVKGHGVGFHGVGVMDYAATSQVHLGVQVGYRFAKTTELKDKAGDVIFKTDPTTGDPTTEKEKADWSGLMTRVGITFLFGKSE